jgi:hydroxymethylglutaryl-CoA reductase (NADPH)
MSGAAMSKKIPRASDDDYSPEIVAARQEFIEKASNAKLDHCRRFSFASEATRGNIENLTGAVQVPLGFAGPLLVRGDAAQGEFFVPMATSEGTLVASYNRGMRLTREAGGIKTLVVQEAMQRAPVFGFADARQAQLFSRFVQERFTDIKAKAEETSSVAKLINIENYLAARFVYLRFNYRTGDAAGQNMTGKATAHACQWLLQNYSDAPIQDFTLSGNLDTDKKASFINTLNTRGKRVIAEVTIPDTLLQQHLHVSSEQLFAARLRSSMGAWMAGSTNNGSHAANALAAVFIATGQDVANVSESHVGYVYSELLQNKDLYYSITLPSLIVATFGGGTNLPTQRECLEVLGCYGQGKVQKLAEVVAATVLCGELSLGAAVVAGHWVEAHERLGRNR